MSPVLVSVVFAGHAGAAGIGGFMGAVANNGVSTAACFSEDYGAVSFNPSNPGCGQSSAYWDVPIPANSGSNMGVTLGIQWPAGK